MLNINEVFYTIQGEGPTTGKPSIFIRLTGCNLKCIWCDTKYTWLFNKTTLQNLEQITPKNKHKLIGQTIYDRNFESNKKPLVNIIDQIQKYEGTNVVISGGEPLLQKDEIIELTHQLIQMGYSIEIETNGTLSPEGLDEDIQFNVSPKLANSYNSKEKRYKPEILKEFIERKSIFKFVVCDKSDFQEIVTIINSVQIPDEKIYLMPEGKTVRELNDKAALVLDMCKKNNYNFTDRLHVKLFGNQRGV